MPPREVEAFRSVVPTGRQTQALHLKEDVFVTTVGNLMGILAPGRYRTLVLTKLEEASMFASQAILRETPT